MTGKSIIYDSHRPSLKSGNYKLNISQTFKVGLNSMKINAPELEFKVEGEQYRLSRQQVVSVFPPASAIGDFSLLLPQLILKRSTLPWEREALKGNQDTPWLALVIFSEEELGDPKANKDFTISHIPLSTLVKPEKPVDPGVKEELISIIAANSRLLASKIPQYDEMRYLSHVRKTEEEQAIVICNQRAIAGRKNIVHLVSLENCFQSDNSSGSIDYKATEDTHQNPVLISLYSWEFFCNDHFIITEEIKTYYVKIKKTDTITIQLPGNTKPKAYTGSELIAPSLTKAVRNIPGGSEYFEEAAFRKLLPVSFGPNNTPSAPKKLEFLLKTFRVGHLPDILKHLNRTPSTLSNNGQAALGKYTNLGYIKLDYVLRNGKKIDALYRSPLIPPSEEQIDDTPILLRHADTAFRYFEDIQSVDISYAAAWELGRLMALQHKNFSIALYKWKRSCYHLLKDGNGEIDRKDYPEVPQFVIKWFEEKKILKGIPFNYMVPDAAMLPFESIRFFTVDETWLKYFIDGAFSIGRISKLESEYDKLLYTILDSVKVTKVKRSGFLLHSVAVPGWPELIISGNKPSDKATSEDKLSPNVLRCIFDKPITSVSIHQKPESIHFGFEDDAAAKNFDGVKSNFGFKTRDTIKPGDVARFAKGLIRPIEVIRFQFPAKV